MFDVDQFVGQCLAAGTGPRRIATITDLVRAAVACPEEIDAAFPEEPERDEKVAHASDDLTVLLVRLARDMAYPPHDHGITAVIGAYEGSEINTYWRLNGSRLVQAGGREIQAGEVEHMGPDVIHSVANLALIQSKGLHVYLGDLFGRPRNLWDPQTHERLPYTDEAYFARSQVVDRPGLVAGGSGQWQFPWPATDR